MLPDTEQRMWGEFLIRQACRPQYGFKFWARSTPSTRTIAQRLVQIDAEVTDEVEMARRDVAHNAVIYKAAAQLGIWR